MVVAWRKAMNVFVEKYILIYGLLTFLEVKAVVKVFIQMLAWLVQIINGLDSRSKRLQMCTVFPVAMFNAVPPHINMAAPYWAL